MKRLTKGERIESMDGSVKLLRTFEQERVSAISTSVLFELGLGVKISKQ